MKSAATADVSSPPPQTGVSPQLVPSPVWPTSIDPGASGEPATTALQLPLEYCLPNGLSIFDRQRLELAFSGGELHIHLIPVNDRGVYTQKDRPSLKEFTRAKLPANCYGLPYGNHALHPENSKYPFAPDGNYAAGGYAGSGAATRDSSAQSLFSGSTGGVGSSAEQSQIAMILAEITGKTPTSNGLNDLLLGPMLRGMVVLR